MALERIVSNKHFSGNYTDEEILNLFSNEEDVKYGEVIIFNDKVNPTLYFLDENGELVSIQKIGIDDGSDLDTLMDEVRELSEDVEGLHTTVINNKEEMENDLAGLTLRLEILEEKEGGDVSPEILEKIETNSNNIQELSQNLISFENKLFNLEGEVEENELVHSAGLNLLNDLIKKLEERIKLLEDGGVDVDLTEIENRLDTAETNISELDERVKLIEEGEVDVDLTEIENRISEVESVSDTNKKDIENINDDINLLEEKDITLTNNLSELSEKTTNVENQISAINEKNDEFETRIVTLENIEPIDLTEIEESITTLETTVSTVSKTANNALVASNESIKTITCDGDDYIKISAIKSDRNIDIDVKTNVVLYKDATETINGLASTLDIKNELNEIKSIIDNYTVNGKIISENPEINTNDLNVGSDYLTFKPEDSQNVLPNDGLTLALAKIEQKMDIALKVLTAALNDLNNRLNSLENNKEESN